MKETVTHGERPGGGVLVYGILCACASRWREGFDDFTTVSRDAP
jgi:hypothetical protein